MTELTEEQKQHGAPLSRKEWDERWSLEMSRFWQDPRTRSRAVKYANEVTGRKYGARPGGSPSAVGLAARIFWLAQVKGMDWKKLVFGAVAAFVAAGGAALGGFIEGGITAGEWGAIVGAGLAGVGLYLKDPNRHRGPDPRQQPGLIGGLKK